MQCTASLEVGSTPRPHVSSAPSCVLLVDFVGTAVSESCALVHLLLWSHGRCLLVLL